MVVIWPHFRGLLTFKMKPQIHSLALKDLCVLSSSTFQPLLMVWKILWRRDRLLTPVFLRFHCGSAGKESSSNVGDLGSIRGLRRSPGEGKGYPLQYSGLENSMDCSVHGVAKSRHDWETFTSERRLQKQSRPDIGTAGSCWTGISEANDDKFIQRWCLRLGTWQT